MDLMKTARRVSWLAALLVVGMGAAAAAQAPCDVPGNPSTLACAVNPAYTPDGCREVCTPDFCIRTDIQYFARGGAGVCVLATDAKTRKVTGSQSLGPASGGRVGLRVSPSGDVALTVLAEGSLGRARLSRSPDGRLGVTEPLSFQPPRQGPPRPPPEGTCTIPGRRQERFGCTGKPPPPEAIERARAACVSAESPASAQVPPQGICSASGCVVVMPLKSGACETCLYCPAWVGSQGEARPLPVVSPYGTVFQLDLRGDELCAHLDEGCTNREACLEQVCYAAAPPHLLRYPDPRFPLEADGTYHAGPATSPVRVDGKLTDAAWASAPEVVGETVAHVRYGAATWGGPADASIRLELLHDVSGLLLAARVRDDRVVPLADGVRSIGTDHLEFDFGSEDVRRQLYAVLLGADGKGVLRQWRDRLGRDVDWPLDAECRWAPTEEGYAVECRIPHGTFFPVPAVPGMTGFALWASDADRPGKQKTLMGPRLRVPFVSQVPPTIDELRSIQGLKRAELP